MKTIWLTVKGYIHPLEGGDDYPFFRGFKIKESQLEAFEIYFKKEYEKDSHPMDDYKITQVTEEEWLKNFSI